MKKLFKKLALMVVALLTFSVGSNYTVKEVKAADTKTYTFSNYAAGKQYAANEEHVLDDDLTVTTTKCHFTSELRIYSSSTNNGYAVFSSGKNIVGFGFNAGNKTDTLVVYGSSNGNEWTTIEEVSVKSSYADYSVSKEFSYNYIKLDVKGTQQVRVKSVTVSFDVSSMSNFDLIAEKSTNFSLAFDYSLSYSEGFEEISKLTFDNTSKRTEFTTSKQVWEENGITITNDKASSSNDIANYSNPVRFYQGSKLTIEAENNISKVEFEANNSTYANAIKNSIKDGSVQVSNTKVTWTGSNSWIILSLSAQVRLNSLSVTTISGHELLDEGYANVSILFGAEVEASLFEGYTVSGGVLIDNAANYTETTIAEVYDAGDFEGIITKNNSLSIVEKTIEEQKVGFYSVGSIVEVIKGAVTNDNKSYLDYKFVAAVYFTLTNNEGSKTVVLKQKSYSVKEMISYYKANMSELGITDEDTINALNEFSNFIG